MKRKSVLFFLIFLITLAVLVRPWARVAAQFAGIQWQEQVNLSNSLSSSTYPTIASDDSGRVHVFWAEDYGGKPVDPENPVEKSNSIVYSEWNGTTWSQPVDLFFTEGGGGFNFPNAVIDSSHRLHLTWQGYNGIYYSQAPAIQAGAVQAWRAPLVIDSVRGDGPRLTIGSDGRLNIIYSAWENALTGSPDSNIYHIQSTDGGISWTQPYRLSDIETSDAKQASYPSLIIDTQNVLHAVWYEAEPPDWTGSSIQYTRSFDNGVTWEVPTEMARRTGIEKWMSKPEIHYSSAGSLHITYVCGEYAYRCHQWSFDNGDTWKAEQNVFGNMLALAGNDALVEDGSGTLYWIVQLRYPSAVYSSYWTGESWSSLQVITDRQLNDGHHVRAVTSLGNQINLVMVDQQAKEIWYFRGVSQAQAQPPVSIPSPIPTSTSTSSPVPTATQQASVASSVPATVEEDQVESNAPATFLVLSVLPVLGLILGAALFRLRGRGG